MKYAYEDLSDEQFEELVVLICGRLLGRGVQGFSTGPDGGRDAKFIGTACELPSVAEPWRGVTIVQAKHTSGYNRKFAEKDFYSESSGDTIIGKELPRIKRLVEEGELDNYLLFANRKLSAGAETEIRNHIAGHCGIDRGNVLLCGVEALEIYLKVFPEIADQANLDPVDSPLIVSPDEISEVVEALSKGARTVALEAFDPPVPRTPYNEKNEINNMSEDYAFAIRRRYLKEAETIGRFLASPENARYQRMYEVAAEELNLKIVARRKDFQEFNRVMEYVVDLLFGRDPVLRGQKRLTRALLFYMYWYCDIGENGDAETF